MFCSNCGKEIDDNTKFCSYCGAKINSKREKNKEKDGNKGALEKIISGVIGFSVLYFIFFGFDIFISNTNEGQSANLEVSESHTCSLGYGARGICGTVNNSSSRNYSYVQVEINLYNKNGDLIGSTLDNVNNLEPHSVWKFQAPIIEDNVSTYKVKNVIGM